MSFDPNILISSTFGDYTKTYLSGSEFATYYIHDEEGENLDIAFGEGDTLQHSGSNENYIRSIFNNLDPFISLDFNEVSTEDDATFRIYSLSDFSRWDDSTFGQVSNNNNYWDILWRNSSSDVDFNRNTIIHEIGHALGLSHPNEDPTNSLWDSDITVMSYNKSINGWNTSFSSNDIQALRLIWGTEEEGIPHNLEIEDDKGLDFDDPIIDDYSQDLNTSGSLSPGNSVNGSIEKLGDRDWFSLDLTAGEILQLQLIGTTSASKICPCFSCNQKKYGTNSESRKSINEDKNLFSGESLRDPFLRLYDKNGDLLYSNDDSGIDLNSLIQFEAVYTGKYFASAGGYNDNYLGYYTLSLTIDDFANDISSEGVLTYGQEIFGNLEVQGDKDWFALNATKGDQFQIDLIGLSLIDSNLNLYSNNGDLLASNDDFSSDGLDSRIIYSSTYSGNYYVSVEGFKNRYKGSYSLSATLINSEIQLQTLNSDLEALNYIASNVDLIRAFGTDLDAAKDHYVSHGNLEGRSISNFNAANYLNNYSDLSDVFGTDLEAAIRHYITNGYAEGRTDLNKNNSNMKIKPEYLKFLSINDDSMKRIIPKEVGISSLLNSPFIENNNMGVFEISRYSNNFLYSSEHETLELNIN